MVEVNIPEIVAEVEAAFAAYEQALNANDVAVLNELFWDNADTIRYGVGENLYGHAAIAAFRSGRKPPGPRRLGRTVITTFGRDFATASTEFFFADVDGVGRQSQSWVRLDGGWRITSAHVSFLRA